LPPLIVIPSMLLILAAMVSKLAVAAVDTPLSVTAVAIVDLPLLTEDFKES